jgi:hypothetical protein
MIKKMTLRDYCGLDGKIAKCGNGKYKKEEKINDKWILKNGKNLKPFQSIYFLNLHFNVEKEDCDATGQ